MDIPSPQPAESRKRAVDTLTRLMNEQPQRFADPALRRLAENALRDGGFTTPPGQPAAPPPSWQDWQPQPGHAPDPPRAVPAAVSPTALAPAALPPAALAPVPPGQERSSLAGRLLRVAGALAVIAVGLAFVHDRFFSLAASRAVLQPVTLTIRAPIAGIFRGEVIPPGRILPIGTSLGRIEDPRAEPGRVIELETRLAGLHGEIAGLETRIAALSRDGQAARERDQAFRDARLGQLTARLDEMQAMEAAALARLREAEAARGRGDRLTASGTVTAATMDQLTRALRVAERELAGLQERRRALAAEFNAARAGLYIGEAATDRSASQQAEDRLAQQRQELQAELGERRNRAEALQRQIAAERLLLEQRSQAALHAPAHVRLLTMQVQPGEYVSQGQEIANLLDCGQRVIMAEVSERVVGRISLGDQAEFIPAAASGPRQMAEVVRLVPPAPQASGEVRWQVELRSPQPPGDRSCEGPRLGRLAFQPAPR